MEPNFLIGIYINIFCEKKEVEFTHSRPYKKNDNAHVEQKNWTHVRENFGYERYDLVDQVEMMNVIYKLYLNNFYNFFVSQLKLIEKSVSVQK